MIGRMRSFLLVVCALAAFHLSLIHTIPAQTMKIDSLERSLSIKESTGDRHGVVKSLCDIGWYYHLIGENGRALESLFRGLAMAEKIHANDKIECALLHLHELYASLEDHKNAYSYHLRLTAHRDSIQTNDEKKQLNELMAKYESEQRERKIEILEKNKALRELEMEKQDEMLQRHSLERLRRQQEIELLSQNNELQQMVMDINAAALRRRSTEAAQKEQKISLLEKDRKLKAASLDQEIMRRNGAILGAFILLILGSVLYRHLRQRRHVSELRATVAESGMQEAEAQILRVRAGIERKEKEAQRRFSHQLLDSQEQERKRIAAELHDSLGQDLIVIKNSLLMVKDRTGTMEDLDRAIDDLGGTLESVRRLSRDLRPLQLDYYGIEKSLCALVARIQNSTSLRVSTKFGDYEGVLDKEQELNVYRIVQEGLNNILKHADARQATISMVPENGSLLLVVEDDGKGMPADTTERERILASGFGLKSMEERVRILGGTMHIEDRAGGGTRIKIRFPICRKVSENPAQETA